MVHEVWVSGLKLLTSKLVYFNTRRNQATYRDDIIHLLPIVTKYQQDIPVDELILKSQCDKKWNLLINNAALWTRKP